MKRIVNGKLCELPEGSQPAVRHGQDRLWVQSQDGTHSALVVRRGDETLVSYRGRTFSVKPPVHGGVGEAEGDSGELRSPLPGQVVEVSVVAGQTVTKGQRLMVMEAMKMQQPIQSPFEGTVDRVLVALGDQVTEGQMLVHVSPAEPV